MFELLRRQMGLEGVRSGRLPNTSHLPLKFVDDIATIEDQLSSREIYSQVVSVLAPMPTLSVGAGTTFESVCLFVCLSVCLVCLQHNLKTKYV